MKKFLLTFFLLIPFLVRGQQIEEEPIKLVSAVYVGDTTYVAHTPITDVDISCQPCVEKYINSLETIVEPITITVYDEVVVISRKSAIIKDAYNVYFKDKEHGIYFTFHHISREKYRLQMIFNEGWYYLNVIDAKNVITTYILKKQ